MPYRFSFDSNRIDDPFVVNPGSFSSGSGWGISIPNARSALASNQSIQPGGDVDVVAVTLFAGRSYTFDIDRGEGDSQPIDLEMDIIDMRGNSVLGPIDDSSRRDLGANDSWSLDPFTTFTPLETGTYFISVHHWSNDYIDGEFAWQNFSSQTGDYSLNIVSNSLLPNKTYLTNASENRTFSNADQIVFAKNGNDNLTLLGGRDIAEGASGNDRILGGNGDDQLFGGFGNDTLAGGRDNDMVRGGNGRDVLLGNLGNDQMSGGNGDDVMYGGVGNDILWGGGNNDRIFGGEGRDLIRGGEGIDRMWGGDDNDVFQFHAGEAPFAFGTNVDVIEDFTSGDLIDLSALSLDPLSWIGNSGFSAFSTNEVRYINLGGNQLKVQVNTDFDPNEAEIEFIVNVSRIGSLNFEDFIL